MISFGCASRRSSRDRVVVDALVLLADAVGDGLEPLARQVGCAPWVRWPPGRGPCRGSVSPGWSRARNTAWLAWLPECGWTLANVAPNSCFGALDGEGLGDVDELAAAVVAPAGIALGVLVGQHRALRVQDRAADDVLRGDQLDLVALAAELVRDGAEDRRVAGGEVFGEEAAVGDGVFHGGAPAGGGVARPILRLRKAGKSPAIPLGRGRTALVRSLDDQGKLVNAARAPLLSVAQRGRAERAPLARCR